MTMLEIKDLHAKVGDKEILKGVNLSIDEGEVMAVMGPNGCGKSTLSAMITGSAIQTIIIPQPIQLFNSKLSRDYNSSGFPPCPSAPRTTPGR